MTNTDTAMVEYPAGAGDAALTAAQRDFLLQRTPPEEIKQREGRGGITLYYTDWQYVAERLNLVFGFNWDFRIIKDDIYLEENEIVVTGQLTVRVPATGQAIVKEQFGGAEIKRHASGKNVGRPVSIADDKKAAGSDALKKCAALLGIGLDLAGKEGQAAAAAAVGQARGGNRGTQARTAPERGREEDAPTPIRPERPPLEGEVRQLVTRINEAGRKAGLSQAQVEAEVAKLTGGRLFTEVGGRTQLAITKHFEGLKAPS